MKGFNSKKSFQGSWALYPQDKIISVELAEALQISLPLAQVMVNRGIKTVAEGDIFLAPKPEHLCSPFAMKDMEAAAEIIGQAVEKGRRIAVYGDYDVDGIGATALLLALLSSLGAEVTYYIPDRLTEGYGLSENRLVLMQEEGVSLLLTVDCGISDYREIAFARDLGMDVVITDHHLPPAELPPANAVINPRRPDCTYPFKELCGAGVAFKLGQALLEQQKKQSPDHAAATNKEPWSGMEEYLDLVTLATVADMVPLLGENRILVSYGLQRMEARLRPGLAAICEVAAAGEKITTETISFLIAPRLNAAGRLGDASRALRLLLAETMEEAHPLALELHEENSRRQQAETKILSAAVELAESMPQEARDFLLLAAADWPQGVIGIVASRLMEQYNCPVMLVSLADGQGKGSGRSGEDFNLTAALKECEHLLLAFGGHRCAAGLTVQEENIPTLRQELNELVRRWRREREALPSFNVDALLLPDQITADLVRELERLEPFGFGNPRPVFLGEKWFVEKKRPVGKGRQHLQLGLSNEGLFFPAIFFNGKAKLPDLHILRMLDVLFAPKFNSWQGRDTLQLELFAGKFSDACMENNISIVDHRGLGRKLDYLKEIAGHTNGYIVFVNTRGTISFLEAQLGKSNNYCFSHQGQYQVKSGVKPNHLVLYDLPLHAEKLKALLDHCLLSDDLTVHLLYGAEDWQYNLKLLTATIPSLSALEQVMHALREIAGTGGDLYYKDALNDLRGRLAIAPTLNLLEKCLQIMEEAACLELDNGKIKIENDQHNDCCKLLGKMKSVEQYNWARKKWEETLRWQKYFLEAPQKDLLDFFRGVQKN